ncbi:P-loop NTPase [Pirellulaceae bacterium SH449]
MSNEVNQAFLRAYVKNRADRALHRQNTQHPAPTEGAETIRDLPNRGDTLRIDQVARQQPRSQEEETSSPTRSVQVPFLPHGPVKERAPQLAPTRPASKPVEAGSSVEDGSGVWSPIGVERAMKGSNRGSSVPAVVVNAPRSLPSANATRVGSRTVPASSTPDTQQPTQPLRQVQASKVASLPTAATSTQRMRIDDGHGTQKRPHIPSVSTAKQASADSLNRTGNSNPMQVAPSVVLNDQLGNLGDRALERMMIPDAPIMAGAGLESTRVLSPSLNVSTKESAPKGSTLPTKRSSPTMPQNGDLHTSHARVPEPKLGPTVKDKTPLAPSSLPLPVAFSPSWEVDSFLWPEVLRQIEKSDVAAFHAISKHLRLANQDGLKVMAVTSGERGVGRSTVAMHLARCAAASGLNVALVDADGFHPSLIDQLKLDLDHGWQECLFENVPLEEVAVKSLEDNMTFFPLTSVIPTQQLHVNLHRMAKVVKRISMAFDMVFLDSNRLNLEQRDLIGVSQERIIDAAIIVTDSELSIKEKIDTAVSILHGMGIASVGLVQNFHS